MNLADRHRKIFKQAAFALFVFASLTPDRLFARNKEDVVQEAYRLGESDARKQLDAFLEAAKVEKKRKEMSGEPPATAKEMVDAMKGVKFFIYNRAATNGICIASALDASANFDAVQACIKARNASMQKFLKLSDYATLPSSRTNKNCELLGRDFDAERRFSPFDFLRAGLGPPILNFEIVNDCLMSD